MNYAERLELKNIVKQALREDVAGGDLTTRLILPRDKVVVAAILANEKGIICGLDIAKLVFKTRDNKIKFIPKVKEGQFVRRGEVIAKLYGRAASILTAERVALNFLSFASGIATKTEKFVKKVKPHKTLVMDTRKTIPGLRKIVKYAVRVGGGRNHRFTLDQMVLVKDNHFKVTKSQGHKVTSVKDIVKKIRKRIPRKMKIEVEVGNLKEFKQALAAKPDIIMLDNMKSPEIKKATAIKCRMPHAFRRILLEASGGINLKNISSIAATGVDMISIGKLTSSLEALDISLDILKS
ncbi:MAG: carboxylating nicotinate-nucleotide diphosphorylase [Candidatus Omnitrophota bacterium]|nr:MAG: carboxylating nicotinate-nucleotide diphosphorylase [Candidatus Omnitrophota bacterium]